MNLENVRYAQGWLDSQLNAELEVCEKRAEVDKMQEAALEQAKQVNNMWGVVYAAVDSLVRENESLRQRIDAAKLALL